MAEIKFTLTEAPFLGGLDRNIGGNRIIERDDLALVSIAVPQDEDRAVVRSLKASFRLDPPTPTASSSAGDMYAIRTTPDQMMLIFPHAGPDAETYVQSRLKGAGYTTDQTDAWVVLEISGPDTLAALERLCPLDVSTMAKGDAARTVMEHMGAFIHCLGPAHFLLFSASSSAESFLRAVEISYSNCID